MREHVPRRGVLERPGQLPCESIRSRFVTVIGAINKIISLRLPVRRRARSHRKLFAALR